MTPTQHERAGIGFSRFLGFWTILVLWLLVTGWPGLVPSTLVPTPGSVARALLRFGQTDVFWGDVLASVLRVSAGFGIAALVASVVAAAAAMSAVLREALVPVISLLRYLPVPALVPIAVLTLGIGEAQRLAIVVLGTVLQLTFSFIDVLDGVPGDLMELGRSLGLRGVTLLRRVVLPWSLPRLWEVVRVGFGWAWGWVMLAEMTGARAGLGFSLVRAQRYLLTEELFGLLLVVGGIGVAADVVFRSAGRRMFRWDSLVRVSGVVSQ